MAPRSRSRSTARRRQQSKSKATHRTPFPASCCRSATRQGQHAAQSKSHAPNNSFKPTPLRGVGNSRYDRAIAAAANRCGLTQALGLQEQSQQSPGSAQAAAATCITHHATAIARSVGESSPASNCKQLSLRHQDQDLQPANAGRARASPTRRTACPTS